MNKPFNLEEFKAGQKSLTRDGRVATFVGIRTDGRAVYEHPDGWLLTITDKGFWWKNELPSINDLVSMVSRHQALIDSYDLEDTCQRKYHCANEWFTLSKVPKWKEHNNYRLHPHNDLIKAHKKGAKIEAYIVGDWVEEPNPDWYEDTQYRIKPEVTKATTKTVYEWLVKYHGNKFWEVLNEIHTEENIKFLAKKLHFSYHRTGRSWEVEA